MMTVQLLPENESWEGWWHMRIGHRLALHLLNPSRNPVLEEYSVGFRYRLTQEYSFSNIFTLHKLRRIIWLWVISYILSFRLGMQ